MTNEELRTHGNELVRELDRISETGYICVMKDAGAAGTYARIYSNTTPQVMTKWALRKIESYTAIHELSYYISVDPIDKRLAINLYAYNN